MVPSRGWLTAVYAESVAEPKAATARPDPTSIEPAIPSANPLSNCDRITPLFPRAPQNAPVAMLSATEPADVASSSLCICSMPARNVNSMLVPVSPSGTGKTLSAFAASRYNSK